VALGLGLWLLTMPLTGAGFFAIELVDGTRAAVGGYLGAALAYAAPLQAFGSVLDSDPERPASRPRAWRSAILLMAGAVGSLAATFLTVRWAPRERMPAWIVVLDPQEPVPSGGIDPPASYPNLVATAQPAPGPEAPSMGEAGPQHASNAAGPSPESTPAPTAQTRASDPAPESTGLPEPPPAPASATDGTGAVQPEEFRLPQPDGGAGWHHVKVKSA
jgi:hypothetical protein